VADVVLVLFVIVDLLGAVGAILVAVPFIGEHGLKRLGGLLREGPPLKGLEGAEKAALGATEAELARFKPADGAFVAWGLVLIAASYALHIVAEVLAHLSR